MIASQDTHSPVQGLFDEVGLLEHRVGDAEVKHLFGLEHAVLTQRVLDDDRTSPVGTDQVGQQVVVFPARDEAQETSSAIAAAPADTVRYLQCRAISSPPPIAAPLMNANVGTLQFAEPIEDPMAFLACCRACARSVACGTAVRSAPTAKMNGLPVRQTAARSVRAEISSSASSMDFNPPGPNEFGLVIEPVVEGDHGGSSGAKRQVEVTNDCLGDNLVSDCWSFRHGGCSLRPGSWGFPRWRWRLGQDPHMEVRP